MEALKDYEAAAQANGFEDVTLSAFQINTGDLFRSNLLSLKHPMLKDLDNFWMQEMKPGPLL